MKVSIKRNLLEYLATDGMNKLNYLRKLMFDLLDAGKAVEKADKEDKLENWVNKLVENVNPSLSGYTKEQFDLAAGLLIYELYSRDGSYRKIYESYSSVVRGGVK